MNTCPKCKAPAKHMPPDGDFRYNPPRQPPFLGFDEKELMRRLVMPLVEQRSRAPGDAWEQAAHILDRIT